MRLLALAVVFSLFLVGCVQQSVSTPTPQATISATPTPTLASPVKEFAVKATHTAYTPNSFEVDQGDTVRFLLVTGPGQVPHNHGITIDEYNVSVAAASDTTPVPIEFVADKKGEFKIWCKTCWEGVYGQDHPAIEATLKVS